MRAHQEARGGQVFDLPDPTRPQEPRSNYETVADPRLQRFLREAEETIQGYQEWPIRTTDVPHRFSHVVGLEKYYLNRLLQTVRKKEVIDVIVENSAGRNSYLLNQDGVRVFLALCKVIQRAMLVGRGLSLENAVAETKKALGSHPLKDLLHDSKSKQPQEQKTLMGVRLPTDLTIGRQEEETAKKKSAEKEDDGENIEDWEEAIIQKIDEGGKERAPFIEQEQLETARRLDREELIEILKKNLSDWFEEVSFQKLKSLGIDIHPNHVKMIMFIFVAFAKKERELLGFDPNLEYLEYPQLRLGIERCVRILEKFPEIRNLEELFDQAKRHVAQKQRVPESV